MNRETVCFALVSVLALSGIFLTPFTYPSIEEVITLPAGAWHPGGAIDSNSGLDRIDMNSTLPGDQQVVNVSPGEAIAFDYWAWVYGWGSGGYEIRQLWFVYSWASSWPPWDAYTSIYDGIPHGTISVNGSVSITVPTTPGTYKVWLCVESHYSMSQAVAQLTEEPTMLPHAIIVVSGAPPSGVMWEDDFESYTVGTFPSPPWQMWFDGKGPSEQRIVDTESVSGSKSLRLWGANGWGAVAARPVTLTPDTIGYEVMVKAENWGLQEETKTGGIVGFGYKISGSLWTFWARVLFQSDGYIRGYDGVIQPYDLDTWYKVKTIFDIPSRTYSVWINDRFKGTFIDTTSYDPSQIEAFTLASDHAEQVCYFDDVKVFEVEYEPIVVTMNVHPETLNLKSKGRWITAYITLPEGYNVEDIVLETVYLDGIPAAWSENQNTMYMVKFLRAAVRDTLTEMIDYVEGTKFYNITLTLTGELLDGTQFEGTDTIKVIKK